MFLFAAPPRCVALRSTGMVPRAWQAWLARLQVGSHAPILSIGLLSTVVLLCTTVAFVVRVANTKSLARLWNMPSDGMVVPAGLEWRHGGAAHNACVVHPKVAGRPRTAVLWSYPGSGNTATRLLAEAATGHLTGSPYHDHSLAHILTAEMLNLSTASGGWGAVFGVLTLTWALYGSCTVQ